MHTNIELLQFPEIEGTNLGGRAFVLPRDFEGRLNLVFVAFRREQQLAVNTWLPVATLLEGLHKDLIYYELPVHSCINPIARWFLNRAMRVGIRYPGSREKTIALYIKKDPFRKALNISGEDNIHVFVLNGEARAVWHVEGSCDAEKAKNLNDFIKGTL
ncbi:MAG: hypothetical protein JSV17_08675 [Candidatus Aminicenantes bacterium]|nr:MAG: hypothetical protein JSV17_08675 [Candidatus Aminicenantes bacterium]